MGDPIQRVRAVLPAVRRNLEDPVRIESVWADPACRAGAVALYRSTT